jgi:hypothetical protein
LYLIVAKGGNGGSVGFHRNVFHRYAQLVFQIKGDGAEPFFQLRLILVGDGGKDEGAGVGVIAGREQQGSNQCNKKFQTHRCLRSIGRLKECWIRQGTLMQYSGLPVILLSDC